MRTMIILNNHIQQKLKTLQMQSEILLMKIQGFPPILIQHLIPKVYITRIQF